jgi:hypothetical protein
MNKACISALLLLTLTFSINPAEIDDAVARLSNVFVQLEQNLNDLAGNPAMRGGVKAVPPLLRQFIRDHEAIVAIMRTNSKGKVVNEIVRNGEAGELYRDISGQAWYRKTSALRPYFSKIRMADKSVQLLWSLPIRIRQSGSERFGGALMVRIDPVNCFETVAMAYGQPFEVFAGATRLYSYQWRSTYAAALTPVTIHGLSGAMLHSQKEEAMAEAPVVTNRQPAERLPLPGAPISVGDSEKKPLSMFIGGLIGTGLLILGIALVIMARDRKRPKVPMEINMPVQPTVFEERRTTMISQDAVRNFNETFIMPTEANQMSPIAEQWGGAAGETFVNQKTVFMKQSGETATGLTQQAAYQEIRAEVEAELQSQFSAALNERTELIRREVTGQIQQSISGTILKCRINLEDQIAKMSQIIALRDMPEHLRLQEMEYVLNNLKQIRDLLSGRTS